MKLKNVDEVKKMMGHGFLDKASHVLVQQGFVFTIVKNRSGRTMFDLIDSQEFKFVDLDFTNKLNPNKATYNEYMDAINKMSAFKNFVVQIPID